MFASGERLFWLLRELIGKFVRIGRVVLKKLGVFRTNVVSKVEPWFWGFQKRKKRHLSTFFCRKLFWRGEIVREYKEKRGIFEG